jgi:hypothetical protein
MASHVALAHVAGSMCGCDVNLINVINLYDRKNQRHKVNDFKNANIKKCILRRTFFNVCIFINLMSSNATYDINCLYYDISKTSKQWKISCSGCFHLLYKYNLVDLTNHLWKWVPFLEAIGKAMHI